MKILTRKKQEELAALLAELFIIQADYITNPDSIKANHLYNDIHAILGTNGMFLEKMAIKLEESDYTEEKTNAEKTDS